MRSSLLSLNWLLVLWYHETYVMCETYNVTSSLSSLVTLLSSLLQHKLTVELPIHLRLVRHMHTQPPLHLVLYFPSRKFRLILCHKHTSGWHLGSEHLSYTLPRSEIKTFGGEGERLYWIMSRVSISHLYEQNTYLLKLINTRFPL